MKPAFLFAFCLLCILPTTVFAGYLDITVNNCVNESSVQDVSFTGCSTTTKAIVLYCTFRVPTALPNFFTAQFEFSINQDQAVPLAPFWHFGAGQCNTSGLTASCSAEPLLGPCNTETTPWGFGGMDGTAFMTYLGEEGGPGSSRFLVTVGRSAALPYALVPGVTYYGCTLVIQSSLGATCAGCGDKLSIVLRGARLLSTLDPAMDIGGPGSLGNCVRINGESACRDRYNYIDADCDGFGDPDRPMLGLGATCAPGPGCAPCVGENNDCDDSDPMVHPGVPDRTCNGVDNNCNGVVDEGVTGCVCIEHAPGLVGWWKGEGNANDATGGHNGTLMNGVTFAAGKVGQAFGLDGIDDYVGNLGTVGTFSFIQNTGIFTIESWIKLTNPNAVGEQAITANTPTSLENGYFFTWDNSSGQQRLRLGLMKSQDSNPIIDASSPSHIITTTGWHHVAAVGNGTTIAFYVDGVGFAGSGVMGAKSSGASSRTAAIGRCPYTSPLCQFNGQIDELVIYNRALRASEIRAIYNAGTNGMCGLGTAAVGDLGSSAYGLEFAAPWPNPSSRSMEFTFELPARALVKADVVDVAGRRVSALLMDGVMGAGRHRFAWDGRDAAGTRVAPGVYLVRVAAGGASAVRRIVLIK